MTTIRSSDHVSAASLIMPMLLLAAATLGVVWQAGMLAPASSDAALFRPETVVVAARSFQYRNDGEFFKGNLVVDPPMVSVTENAPLTIMKYQVTFGQYATCVAEGACKKPEAAFTGRADVPVTGVSFDDAATYAAWLSAKTGESWMLPTDRQLAFAAGPDFPDDALGLDPDNRNPALRWLADYKREAAEKATRDPTPRPVGSYGINEFGLADFGGNVWEWTTTCHRRVHLDALGAISRTEPACGVYVTVGSHRSPMSSFVRDPRGGGCAVGTPPSNLGFRLLRDDRWYAGLLRTLHIAS